MKKNKQEIIYSILAVVFFAILLVVFRREETTWYTDTVEIAVFGDSLIGEYRDEDSVTELMEEILGKKVYNGALGGTCYCYTDTTGRRSYTKDALNLAGLSQAIYADDFRPQLNARIRDSATEYFYGVIEDISWLEYEKMDVLFLAYGMNDYHAAVPFDNQENPYDPYTLKGSIRHSVRNIKEAYPDLRIILVTPTYSWYHAQGLTCENYDTGNGVLEDYVAALTEVTEELDLEIIDLYHDFYRHDTFDDWQIYTNDGLHPNETGRRMIAEKLSSYLQENP